jgi:hypothetical protein
LIFCFLRLWDAVRAAVRRLDVAAPAAWMVFPSLVDLVFEAVPPRRPVLQWWGEVA